VNVYIVRAHRDGERFLAGYYKATSVLDALMQAKMDYQDSAAGRECRDLNTYEWTAKIHTEGVAAAWRMAG
jgi:hypothetical protein